MSNDPFAFLDEDSGTTIDDAPEGDIELDLDFGQGEADGDTLIEPSDDGEVGDPTPEHTYFDPTPYADQLVKVKVDGEEVEVPVAELTQGYQRQADYTRKTQELAQQRQRLEYWETVDRAMQANPEMAFQILQQTFMPGGNSQPAQAVDDDFDSWEDPQSRELQELRSQVASANEYIAQQQAAAYLDQVVNGLSAKYGDDFNPQEVIREAVNRGINDPSMLETVYHSMAFARMQASQQIAGQQAATQQQRAAAAQRAAQIVTAGPSAAGAFDAPSTPPRQPRTVAEAWEMAKAELATS